MMSDLRIKSIIKNRIVVNASWIIICRIGQSILSFIITFLTARYLGPSNYGLINYAAAIVAFLAPVVQLGFNSIHVQEYVDNPEDEGRILGTSLLLSFLSGIVGIIGVFAFVSIANTGEMETLIVCLLYSLVLLFEGAEIIRCWYQAKYLSKYSSIVSLIAFAIVAIYKLYLLISGQKIIWFALASPFDFIIILSILLIVYRRKGGKRLSYSHTVARRMLSKSKYYIISNLMIVVFTQTDRIMLNNMMDSSATGYYSAASTCAHLANFVFVAIIDSARPTIFENLNISIAKFEKSLVFLYTIIIYSTLLFSLFVSIFAYPMVTIIYGNNYIPAISALRVIAWFAPFSFIGNVRDVWILSQNKQKWIPVINVLGAAANVLINFILIPIWGIVGASVASLVTQVFSNILITTIIKDTRESTKLLLKGFNLLNVKGYFN